MDESPPGKEKRSGVSGAQKKNLTVSRSTDTTQELAAQASRERRLTVSFQTMTKSERESLLQVVRLRAKVAKSDATAYSAKLRADFEQQLDTKYSFDQDAIWQEMASLMQATADEAAAKVAARNRELGIPDWAAPRIVWGWRERGENATKERRAELRRLAHVQIEAIEKEARARIDRTSSEVQTKLYASGLTTEAANLFLEQIPSIESLMPALELTKIEALLGPRFK
jgi:hypothetical protein